MSFPLSILWVGLGGALGAIFRHLTGDILNRLFFNGTNQLALVSLPLATLTVNLTGCFAAGALLGWWGGALPTSHSRLFLMTGVLGGFTTFSAFTVESLVLIRDEPPLTALLYLLMTVGGSLVCGVVGLRLFSAAS